jgi:hypothetical protein
MPALSRVAGAQPVRGEREGSPLAQTLLIPGGAARERCAALRLIFMRVPHGRGRPPPRDEKDPWWLFSDQAERPKQSREAPPYPTREIRLRLRKDASTIGR